MTFQVSAASMNIVNATAEVAGIGHQRPEQPKICIIDPNDDDVEMAQDESPQPMPTVFGQIKGSKGNGRRISAFESLAPVFASGEKKLGPPSSSIKFDRCVARSAANH